MKNSRKNNPNSKITKMKDILKGILTFTNCIFVYDQINEEMPSNIDGFFTTSENQHPYNTRGRKYNTITKTLSNSKKDIELPSNGMKSQELSIL